MPQASGAYGQLLRGCFTETGYNYSPTSMSCYKAPINTSNIRASQNLVTPATLLGRRSAAAPYAGNVDVRGTVVVPIDVNNTAHWLRMLFGSPVTASGPVVGLWTHTFKPTSATVSFAVEQGFTDQGQYYLYNGCKVDRFSLSVRGDEELVANVDIVGGKETPGITSAMSGTTTLGFSRFTKFNATIKEGGTSLATVTECELNIQNNLGTDVYLIDGTPYRGDLPDGIMNASGRLRAQFINNSLYLHALSGTTRAVELKFTQGSYYLAFNCDEVKYSRQAPALEGPGPVWIDLPFNAFYDADADASVVYATLVNSVSSYY